MFFLFLFILFSPAIIGFVISSDFSKDLSFLNYFYTDNGFFDFLKSNPGDFFPLIQINTNAYFNWRYDFIFYSICKYLNLGFNFYIAFLLLFSAFGFYLLIPQLKPAQQNNKFSSCVLIAILQLSFLLIFGLDTMLLSFLAWVPWILFGCLLFLQQINSINLIFFSLILILSYISLNQLSLVIAIFLIFIVLSTFENISLQLKVFLLAVLVFLPLILSYLIPPVSFPNYPTNAHLVPFYGVADGLQTNIGNQPKLLAIDREAVRARYLFPATVLLLGILVIRFNVWKRNILLQPKLFSVIFNIFLVLYLFILLDSYLFSPFVNQLSPLASISRMLPSLFYLPLAHCVLCLLLLSYFIELFFIDNLKYSLISCFVILLPLIGLDFKRGVAHPILANRTFSELDKFVNKSSLENLNKIFNSPSLYLLRKEGSTEIELQSNNKKVFLPLEDFQFEIFSSDKQQELKNVSDQDENTRWSESSAKQAGKEWILIKFANPESINGIKLKTGKFYADFPRGIEISNLADCSTTYFNFENFSKIYSQNNYQGEIQISTDGYPYYIEQYNFSRIFTVPATGKCLLIKQISNNDNFDWSVAEIELLK